MTHTTRLALLLSSAILLTSFEPWVAHASAQSSSIIEPAVPWDESEKLNQALERTVHFPGIDADEKLDLAQVLKMLEKKYGLSFNVNEASFRAEHVDNVLRTKILEDVAIPEMKNVSLRTVLKRILARVPAETGTTYLVRRDTIEITTGAAWYRALGFPEGTTSSLVKKQFKKTELREALQELGPGVIDVRVAKKVRTKITARFYYVPVETVVELLADMAGLAVVHRSGAEYITSPENAARMKKQLAARQPEEPWDGHVFARPGLHTLDSTEPGISLRRALDASAEERGINLVIDPRVEKKLRVTVTAHVAFASTQTALDLLADMAGLAVVKKDNVYYVTSPGNAERIRKESAKPPETVHQPKAEEVRP